MPICLAIDIGASSGRHLLGELENGKLKTTEVYRFENGMKRENGSLTWDIEALTAHVIEGIAACRALGKTPDTVSIDTWGVDYVLLDGKGKEILPCYAYRDSRTEKMPEEVFKTVPEEVLYRHTGIQKQTYNTLYQLMADKLAGRLEKAQSFLMMPEYLSYKLTGAMRNEYTNASTSSMVNAASKTWDADIINGLGINADLFLPLSTPGTEVGKFSKEIEERVGFGSTVTLAPSHDTASAVAACPIGDNSVYVSSGTWSLMGTENTTPILSDGARDANFTNEGGVDYRFRFLKNIMGMWLFQNVRRNLDKKYSYDEMMKMAMESDYVKTVDVNDESLVCPENMITAINKLAGEDLPLADTLSCIYHSLASMYAKTVREIESITGKSIDSIFIVGGGSKDSYLNELTSRYTGKKVVIGLSEATATGNLITQLMRDRGITLWDARKIVANSFNIKEIEK